MKAKKSLLIPAALAMAMLILDSRAASNAACKAMDMCIRSVIPCLFPFFLLSGYLTGSLRGGKMIARLFRIPDNAGGILLSGLLAGYPVGAKMCREAVDSGQISAKQGNRMLMFCSQAGPSFLFGVLAAQFDSIKSIWMLWIIQTLSTLSVARIFPEISEAHTSAGQHTKQKSDPMQGALKAMGSVCGWVIMFYVLISFLDRWILWMIPEATKILICGLLELTNGCLLLRFIVDPDLRLLLAAVMLNCGGICVLMQTASVTEGLDIRCYLLGKTVQTIFAIFFALLFLGHYIASIPIICLYSIKYLLNFRKSCSIPRLHGV